MDPQTEAWKTNWKAGNMLLNLFCIDEFACFELSQVYSLKKCEWYQLCYFVSSRDDPDSAREHERLQNIIKRKGKGKEFS